MGLLLNLIIIEKEIQISFEPCNGAKFVFGRGGGKEALSELVKNVHFTSTLVMITYQEEVHLK